MFLDDFQMAGPLKMSFQWGNSKILDADPVLSGFPILMLFSKIQHVLLILLTYFSVTDCIHQVRWILKG